ncbi:MAG: helix-turn-helix domain-containing protein [Oscillospiraceae bacterium]|jgi:transcriptional regulator with XRE-family HTH domain|nr:helix-turn-helix domain-containing protein [Oscillospiraceae bacterium]
MPYTIGQNIRRLRIAQTFTQQQLAALLNVSPKTVSKWETGAGAPDIAQIVPLSRALGVTTDELLTREDNNVTADRGLPAEVNNKEQFAKIRKVYNVRIDTICEAAGVSEQDVKDVFSSGEFSKNFAEASKTRRLSLILSFLSSLIEMYYNDRHILISTLSAKLLRDNYVTAATVAQYARLAPEALNAYLGGYGTLTAENEYSLAVVLFLLDGVLNREDAFPWG